jgi:CubicO group peptidase (beta-lactamase class C family)
VKSVDADSLYRIGNPTQLFTVYTFLIEAGDVHWEEPVTKSVPELAQAAKTLDAKSQQLRYVNWDDVTLGELASHLSGIAQDCESQLIFEH